MLRKWRYAEPEAQPSLVKIANIQHLGTPIHAQLADPRSAVELAGMLHPTPAIGGEPWPDAGSVIDELEAMDRGWYAKLPFAVAPGMGINAFFTYTIVLGKASRGPRRWE